MSIQNDSTGRRAPALPSYYHALRCLQIRLYRLSLSGDFQAWFDALLAYNRLSSRLLSFETHRLYCAMGLNKGGES